MTEGDSVVVTGEVSVGINADQDNVSYDLIPQDDNEEEQMSARDIYKELKLRGYQYSGRFRGLRSATITARKGHVEWIGNWVTFMDTLLQLCLLRKDTRDLYVPTGIEKLVINPARHTKNLQNLATETNKGKYFT